MMDTFINIGMQMLALKHIKAMSQCLVVEQQGHSEDLYNKFGKVSLLLLRSYSWSSYGTLLVPEPLDKELMQL